MVECFKCGCDDNKCVIIACKTKGEDKFICDCCIRGECEECK